MSRFARATKIQRKARVALVAPSGGGKSYTGLILATQLAKLYNPDGRVAVIDTEHGSASDYADLFEFDVLELTDFRPSMYEGAMREAEQEGFDSILTDSLSHAWMGKGGLLEQVDNYGRTHGGNSFAGWRDATPQHTSLIETMLSLRSHLVVTMRQKTEYLVQQNERGKAEPVKVGLAPVQRDGMEYEFQLVLEMTVDNVMSVSKSRCPDMRDVYAHPPTKETFQPFLDWLNAGADPIEAAAQLLDEARQVWDDPYALRQILERASSRNLHTVTVPGVAEVLAGEARPLVDILTARGKQAWAVHPDNPNARAADAQQVGQAEDSPEARHDAAMAAQDTAGAPAQSETGQ